MGNAIVLTRFGRSPTTSSQFPRTSSAPAVRPSRIPGDPGVDWGAVVNGYNYMDAPNGKGAFAGKRAPFILASRYGRPQQHQNARGLRLLLRFTTKARL